VAGPTNWAETIPGTSRGEIEKILSYDAKKHKYRVQFKMPDGTEFIDIIQESYLRSNNPTSMSKIEKEFFKRQK
jgi:hypothetical protein